MGEPATEEESPVFVEVQPSVETVKPQRPGSLSLIPVNNIEGVNIDTPSNGILSFNTLLEGKTGLTPTNILSPSSLWGPVKVSSSLNTPTWEPGETTDSDGPPESQHSGSPHLTVTSSSH